MTVRLEKLAVELVANGQKFNAELAKSQGNAERWGRGITRAIGVGTGAMIAAGTAATALTVKTIRLADEIAKNSKAAGVSAETYQSWEFAASQAGVSNDKFSVSLERATKRIGEAARGFGGAKKTLDDYNISVFDSRGNIRSTEDVIREFSDRLKGMETAAERTAAVTALFGREGIRMGLVFGQGADTLKEFEDRARDLGLVIDRGVLEKAEEANDQLDIMNRIIKARLISSMSQLFPTVISIGNSFASATPKLLEFSDALLNLVFNTDKAQIAGAIRNAKDGIKFQQAALRQVDEALVAVGDDEFTRKRLERARKNILGEIDERRQLIEQKHQQLAKFEVDARKRSADLIDQESLRLGGDDTGLNTNLRGGGDIKGKTFEELQADAAQDSYARRFTALSEFTASYLDKSQEILDRDLELNEKRIEAEHALRDAKISIAEDIFGTLGNLAKEDSKAQRVLFAAQKASSLAKSIIALQEAIAKANSLGFPENIPAIASATAIGASAISTIRGVSLSGVAHGGLKSVPREGTYLLDQGERVVSPRQNRDLEDFMRSGRGGDVIVQLIQAPGSDSRFDVQRSEGANGQPIVRIEEIRDQVRRVVGEDISSGRGIAGAFEQMYGVRRRGAA